MPDTPSISGRYTLYETPDGGYHIAYNRDGDDEIHHIDIPPALVKMAKMAGKNPAAFMMGNRL